jgi:hypothetical protein
MDRRRQRKEGVSGVTREHRREHVGPSAWMYDEPAIELRNRGGSAVARLIDEIRAGTRAAHGLSLRSNPRRHGRNGLGPHGATLRESQEDAKIAFLGQGDVQERIVALGALGEAFERGAVEHVSPRSLPRCAASGTAPRAVRPSGPWPGARQTGIKVAN